MEYVDILAPPDFRKTGVTKTLQQAWEDEEWIGTFNLWIVQAAPVPAVIYQQRSMRSSWAPGLLDVTAGGHYSAGEEVKDGLREVEEELGKRYDFGDITLLGRKMHVGPDVKGRMRKNLVDVFIVRDDAPLDSYVLEEREVEGLCACPVADLLRVHAEPGYVFEAELLEKSGGRAPLRVTKDSFPFNWDDYHFKMAVLADRFLKGEKYLLY